MTEKSSVEKKKRGRPRQASSERLSTGQRGARPTLTIDGESVRRRVRLETSDPAVAALKIEKLQSATHEAVPRPSPDSFRLIATVVFAERKARGVTAVKIEEGRVEKHVYPFVGALVRTPFGERRASAISAAEVLEVLTAKRDEGYGYEQVNKIRQGIKSVLDHAGREGLASKMPPFVATLEKTRAVASDAVLLMYLAWQHPVPRFRAAVRMRQAMSAVSRCIGGQRTNDLHVATWQDNLLVPEAGEPTFEEVWVPRTKKQAPQLLETPEGVRPMLRLWWEQSGRPRRGPVFPLLRGERAGEARDQVQDSHAHALRQDLRRALGLEVWDGEAGRGERGPVGRWVPGRAPTAKERALFEEGRYTLPVDFHSWRRAWSQALKRVGANVQTSAALTGHASDLRAHARYLQSPTEAERVPAGVVPMLLPMLPAPGVSGEGKPADGVPGGFVILGREPANNRGGQMTEKPDSLMISGRARKDSNLRPLASEGNSAAVLQGFSHDAVVSEHGLNVEKTTGDDSVGQNYRPIIDTLDQALELAVQRAMAEGDITSAKALLDVAERRRATLPDNVRTLDAARKGKS